MVNNLLSSATKFLTPFRGSKVNTAGKTAVSQLLNQAGTFGKKVSSAGRDLGSRLSGAPGLSSKSADIKKDLNEVKTYMDKVSKNIFKHMGDKLPSNVVKAADRLLKTVKSSSSNNISKAKLEKAEKTINQPGVKVVGLRGDQGTLTAAIQAAEGLANKPESTTNTIVNNPSAESNVTASANNIVSGPSSVASATDSPVLAANSAPANNIVSFTRMKTVS
jgi:hypothetical protein